MGEAPADRVDVSREAKSIAVQPDPRSPRLADQPV
jgi:hypothetical protein